MLKKIIILFLLVFFGSIYSIIHAQFTLQYSAETNIITGNGEFTPFYLMNNRGGVISFTPNNGYLRAGVSKKIDNDKRFSYGFGIDLIGSYNNDATIYLQQLYGEIKYRCLGLMIGSKEQYSLMRDRELSSGSMVWSGNSRPIPQVSVGIPHFVNFPGTNGWMQIKGEISYGIFVDDAYQKEHKGEGKPYSKHVLYHRKYLILKFEKEKPFYGSIGIDMAAQFGGTIYDNPNFKTSVTKFPSGIKSFFKVFVPLSGGNDSPLIDQVNVTGNHLGSYLLEIGYRKKNWHAKLYHERYFDDHSGMIFKNKWDGLWGIEYRTIKKKPITGAVFEIMNSKDQSGPFLFDKTEELPSDIVALSFNLYEPYGLEMVGSTWFDEKDEDWACDESFEPAQRSCPNFEISDKLKWEEVLEIVVAILKDLLNELADLNIFRVEHIAVGFVDGDLIIIK